MAMRPRSLKRAAHFASDRTPAMVTTWLISLEP